MADRSVQIDFSVQDNASAQIKKVEQSLGGFANEAKKVQAEMSGMQRISASVSSGFKSLGTNVSSALATMGKTVAIGAAAAGAALVKMGVDSVKAASEAQVEMARFEATLKTMGKAGEEAKESILALSQANIQLGFDDEETANSMAYLLQRTNDLTQATELNGLAMELARAKNMSLSEASKMVGMVLSGNGRVLKQYGIDIKESATPLEALADLQTKVAGQSKAFAQTYAGAMAILKVSIQNVQETVGEQLLPVLADLATRALPFITKALELVPVAFNMAKDAISGFANEMQRVLESEAVATALESVKTNLQGLWQSLVLAGQAVNSFMAMLSPQLQETLAIIGLTITNGIITAIKLLVDSFTIAIKFAQDFAVYLQPLTPLFMAIGGAIEQTWTLLGDLIISIQQLFADTPALQEALKLLGFIFTGVLAVAIGGVILAINGFIFVIKTVIDWVKIFIGWLSKLVEDITFGVIVAVQKLGDIWNSTWQAMKAAFQPIYDWISEKINALVSAFSKLGQGVSSIASAAGKSISTGVNAVLGKKESGGYIPQTGVYLMHKGEWVSKANDYKMVGVNSGEKSDNGQVININITGNSFMGKEDIAVEIGNEIMAALKKEMRIAY